MRLRHVAGALCALILSLACASRLHAQTIASGALEGIVRDAAGMPLGDVTVTLSSPDGGGSRTVGTPRDGAFRFILLPPGTYAILVERLGYRPKRIEGVPVQTGGTVRLNVSLTAAPPPVDAPEIVRFPVRSAGSRAGVSQSLSILPLAQLPWARRDLIELTSLSSATADAFEVEGLPASLAAIMIDGLPFSPARHQRLGLDLQNVVALPLSALQSADLVTGDPDLEWSGFASGALATHTRRGTPDFGLHSFGSWSGGPLQKSKFFDASDLSPASLWGGLVMSSPVIRDTASIFIGFETRRLETARPAAWGLDGPGQAALLTAARARGIELADYTQPFVLSSSVLSGFGRFDWQLTNDNALSVRVGFGQISPPGGATNVGAGVLPGALGEGQDLILTTSLASTFQRNWANEVRVGIARSTRDYNAELDDAAGVGLAGTRIVESGIRFGTDPALPARLARTDLTAVQALEIPLDAHRIKLGFEVAVSSHERTNGYAQNGEFVLGSSAELTRGAGAFFQTTGSIPTGKFTLGRYGALVQDTWNAGPDLSVVAGVRFDFETIPADQIRLNQNWFDYTGLANTDVPKQVRSVSPRLGLTWDVGGQGSLIVRAAAGVYGQSLQPEVLAEGLSAAGDLRIRRGTGDFGLWPDLPTTASVPVIGPPLTLLAPDFRSPLTTRASFGLSRRVGLAMLHLSGSYRETKYLPRRADLNLLATPSAHDQHGRPIYGQLLQFGQLIAPSQPNRRFSDFDLVSAINVDGRSRYWGITAALERAAGEVAGLFASYTYSRTTDNWLAARDGHIDAQLTPFPENTTEDWRDGISDFDITHRVSAGFDVHPRLALQPRLTALFRHRSGYPFTPGFRDGVDVNGDGSGRNDPAFVDESVAGIPDLVNTWDCLRDQGGQFAERNVCRTAGVHTLDLRLGLTIIRSARVSAALFADGLNLIESEIGEVDRALYLVDSSQTLTVNQSTGVVTLPLVANPRFGQTFVHSGTGKLFRIGIQVNY